MRADVRFVQKRHHIPRLFVKKLQPNREIRIRLVDRLFSFFTILLSLCYLRRWYGSQRGEEWPPIASIFATQGAEWVGAVQSAHPITKQRFSNDHRYGPLIGVRVRETTRHASQRPLRIRKSSALLSAHSSTFASPVPVQAARPDKQL